MTPEVRSTRNENVREVKRLVADSGERRRRGRVVLEGLRACNDHVAGGGEIALALVAPRLDALEGGMDLRLALTRACGDRLLTVTDDVMAAASDTRAHQGVLLVVPRRVTSGLPAATSGEPILVAWELQDPGNVGTLARTAEASGMQAMVIARGGTGQAADPLSPRAIRSSAGSALRLPLHEWFGEPEDLANRLSQSGFRLVACVAERGVPHDHADLRGALALVLGSESHGLPDALVEAADVQITIPLSGAVESLNAAAAGAVIAFEAARQRRARPAVDGAHGQW